MRDIVLSPTDFVALINQTLEFAYPGVVIEGELCDFRISKNRWVYFSLRDEVSTVSFFGTVYMLPGPLEDGMSLRVAGAPRMHPKFGFTVNVQSMAPVGEGSIKKAADLLRVKLEAEGLFAVERKRDLPSYPRRMGLITAAGSAAYADFIKVVAEHWGGVEILFADVYVQGDQAPIQIARAIEHFNQLSEVPEILVITRGGGSGEDLAAFNDERVVRAVAASRVPTLVAVGHEIDESLAELAADVRASTPTNAAQIAVPNRRHELMNIDIKRASLSGEVSGYYRSAGENVRADREYLTSQVNSVLDIELEHLNTNRRLAALFDPAAAIRRGYAMVRKNGRLITNISQVGVGDDLSLQVRGGRINSKAMKVIKDGDKKL